MEFNIYNPSYLVLYSIFLIIMYIVVLILLETDKRKKHNFKSKLILSLSAVPIVFAIIYEAGAGFFADTYNTNYYPTMLFTGDFLQIAIPAMILVIASHLLKSENNNNV